MNSKKKAWISYRFYKLAGPLWTCVSFRTLEWYAKHGRCVNWDRLIMSPNGNYYDPLA